MTEQQLARRMERASNETLVITPIAEGLRVYSPHNPATFYLVGGSQGDPECSCPDFQKNEDDPQWRCKHILAAWDQLPDGNGHDDHYAQEERRAIQEENQSGQRRTTQSPSGNGFTTMLLKRSVSPDGRIDSLSAEFSCPVDGLTETEVQRKAEHILSLQSGVVSRFLNRNGSETGNGKDSGNGQHQPAASGEESPAVPARLLNVAGMDGKWGRRLFINVEIDGRITKLFGNHQQLADHLVTAGFAEVAEHLDEGMTLNLPCLVITKPSPDGRYQNVHKVLPSEAGWRGPQ